MSIYHRDNAELGVLLFRSKPISYSIVSSENFARTQRTGLLHNRLLLYNVNLTMTLQLVY